MPSTDSKHRKAQPVTTGVLDYFPDAIVAVAEVSYAATAQHHPGQPMHWERGKSMDQADCIGRHLIQRGTWDIDCDKDGQEIGRTRHSAKLAWRALALLQLEIEAEQYEERRKERGEWKDGEERERWLTSK